MQATKTDVHLKQIQAILSPVITNTGISNLNLSNASGHKIEFTCKVNDKFWNVRLLPTFHGLEVKIHGQDILNSKALISRVFRDTFPLLPADNDSQF